MKTEAKRMKGSIEFQITIQDGNVNLESQESNENNLIALYLAKNVIDKMIAIKAKSDFHGVELTNYRTTSNVLASNMSTLAAYIMDKYKDAVPEEKKVKLLKYNPILDKNLKLKK